MSMQNESKDTKANIDSGNSQGGQIQPDTQESGENANQQGQLPPSQTDDDQYDQGTVKRVP